MAPRNRDDGRGWFGIVFPRRPTPPTVKTITPPVTDDGAIIVQAGGSQNAVLDVDQSVKTEADLINRYREMSMVADVDRAIGEITDEAICIEEGKQTVEIVLDNLGVPDNIKQIIQAEFENILNILDFQNICHETFRRWYVEGRLYYHMVIDEQAPQEGIKELRWIDPTKIRKIREVMKVRDPNSDATLQITRNEYYIYNETGLNYGTRVMSSLGTQGVRIQKDSILHVPSGLTDVSQNMGLSYLHMAIRETRQLRQMEDSVLIYYYVRAPERRIFYIDVGNLPKMKAEQYLRDQMTRQKNKLAYDAQTGEIRDDRKYMTVAEDMYFPVRDGSKGTRVEPLSGGTQLPDLMQAVEMFTNKLYRALQVPVTRLDPSEIASLGRATEITRDELKFSKFIDKLRMKFSQLFLKALRTQLILKGVTTDEDWEVMRKYITFKFLRDSYTTELKDQEILMQRLATVAAADQFTFKYFPPTWIRKKILMQTDEEIYEMDLQSEIDMQNPLYAMAPGTSMFEEEDDPQQQQKPPPKKKPAKKKPEKKKEDKKPEKKSPDKKPDKKPEKKKEAKKDDKKPEPKSEKKEDPKKSRHHKSEKNK